jgi:alcohol dehydrogenase class IV
VKELCGDLQVPPLGAYGFTEDDFGELAQKAARASSMKGNPIQLLPAELEKILADAL